MKIASVADVKAKLSEYLKATVQGPVVVTRNGKAVAMLVAVGDDDLERLLMAHSPRLQAILGAARQRIDEGKGIPHKQFWEQVEKESGKRQRRPRAAKSNQR